MTAPSLPSPLIPRAEAEEIAKCFRLRETCMGCDGSGEQIDDMDQVHPCRACGGEGSISLAIEFAIVYAPKLFAEREALYKLIDDLVRGDFDVREAAMPRATAALSSWRGDS